MSHTPGPWKVEGQTITGPRYAIIADIPFPGMEPAGNAHLIAASPDLLKASAALLSIVESLCDWDDGCLYVNEKATPEFAEPMRLLKAAIAKATRP